MKSVKGNRTYNLVESSKRSLFDGEVYKVEGSTDLYAKLLKDCSKAKLQEVQSAMNQSRDMFDTISDEVIDILYSRTSFIGYVYRDNSFSTFEEPKDDELIQEQIVTPKVKKTQKNGTLESLPVKILLTVVCAALIAFLNLKSLFLFYIGMLLEILSETAVRWIANISFNGYTSLIIGTMFAILIILKTNNRKEPMSTIPFVLLFSIMMLLGIVIVDVVIAVIIGLIFGALSLLKMLLPTIIAIAILFVLFKYILKSFFK